MKRGVLVLLILVLCTSLAYGNCYNSIKDDNEEGIDCGGPCQIQDCCINGYWDATEQGQDCGGECSVCTKEINIEMLHDTDQVYEIPQLSFTSNLPSTISYTIDDRTFTELCTICTHWQDSVWLGYGPHMLTARAEFVDHLTEEKIWFTVVKKSVIEEDLALWFGVPYPLYMVSGELEIKKKSDSTSLAGEFWNLPEGEQLGLWLTYNKEPAYYVGPITVSYEPDNDKLFSGRGGVFKLRQLPEYVFENVNGAFLELEIEGHEGNPTEDYVLWFNVQP